MFDFCYLREKVELWLPNGIPAPRSINISNLGTHTNKSSTKYPDISLSQEHSTSSKHHKIENFVKPMKVLPQIEKPKLATKHNINNSSSIISIDEQNIRQMADYPFFYKPSFADQESAS